MGRVSLLREDSDSLTSSLDFTIRCVAPEKEETLNEGLLNSRCHMSS